MSAATIWEIEIKRMIGRIRVEADAAALVDESGFDRLAINFEHATEAGRLPLLHRDPFDRMLIAQALVERLTLVTGDAVISRYEVPVLSAIRSP